MIELPELGVPGMWETLLDIAERVEDGWTLVGGPMTLLHALEHGIDPPRVSRDLDVIVDIRARPARLPAMLAALDELGFAAVEVSVTEVAHRFARGETKVDLLAPDGLGKRADLRTFGRAATVEIGGGSYALARSERLAVSFAGRAGTVHRPDLAGALLIKAVAAHQDRKPERHLSDLTFLSGLIVDPIALRDARS